ncbi:MAG: serine protease [Motiliproteus sp.]
MIDTINKTAVMRRLFSGWFLVVLIVTSLISWAPLTDARSKSSDAVMAARVMSLYNNATEGNQGEDYYHIVLLVDEILKKHPKSITALRFRSNKYKGIDINNVRKIAGEWIVDNPEKAKILYAYFKGLETEEKNKPKLRARPSATKDRTSADSTASLNSKGMSFQQKNPMEILTTKPSIKANDPARKIKYTQQDIIKHLKDTTVLVLIMNRRKGKLRVVGHGSGFFINKDQILTNAHVVRGANQIVVASRNMGIGVGSVAAIGMTSKGLGIDAAVVDVRGIVPNRYLTFAHSVMEGDNVAIGGYPSVIASTDRNYIRLLHFIDEQVVPSTDDVPSTRFSFGAVEAIFINRKGNEDLQHGVETTGGNSGSPIVNSCGHVVGLHYTGVSKKEDNSKFNYAHTFREVEKFLKNNGISYSYAESECDQG